MNLNSISKFILEKKLLKRDQKGKVIERPEEMFLRVAKNIASADELYKNRAAAKETQEEFYQAMSNLEFLPNFPTLRNAGRKLQQLSACFVLPVGDSIEEIFEAVKNMALVQKSGGGTGFSFSRLRPKGSKVKGTAGIASGPVSFMEVFDAATGAILEGGVRRGANLGSLRVDHPDILEFITCKKEEGRFPNFNISVAITDKFMEALKKNKNYQLFDPLSKKAIGELSAKKVMDEISKMAWLNGEPGIIFVDRINKFNPTPELGEIETTNVCGEVDLLPWESCNLGSINLNKIVEDRKINWKKLRKLVYLGVHFLDNVIDKSKYPLKRIERTTKKTRKIGLGVMGFADLLIRLGIPYDSKEALRVGEKIMRFIKKESHLASQELARERGVFPAFKGSIYSRRGFRLRNATTTAIAPTGILSLIADCSPGIEPIYAPVYQEKTTFSKKPLLIINSLFKKIAKEEKLYSSLFIKKVLSKGSLRGLKEISPRIQRVFVCAHDISWQWHLRMQAVFQKYTDNSISKTVNLPHEARVKDIKKIFITAYQLGLKGLTVYREKSRKEQVLETCPVCKI